MSVNKKLYGKMNGAEVFCFTLNNKNGTSASIIEKGATLDKIFVKANDGTFIDVLSGFDDLDSHINLTDNQGVTVGQYANRIANGVFSIDGTEYHVTKNEKGITCLHGGDEYSSVLWHGEADGENAAVFTYLSPDGCEGFPGNVKVSVRFELTENDELILDYKAVSDKKTVINLTNHAYFNLNGSGDILGHTLTINADRFTPIDALSIPTGELKAVAGTPFDFTAAKKIGDEIAADDEQLKNGNGYDHNFCIKDYDGTLRTAAFAVGDKSGITLEVKTDLPGIQLYTGNFLDGSVKGKGGIPLTKRCSFCLETQVYPDSPNHPEWYKCVYDADEEYKTRTVFAFGLK